MNEPLTVMIVDPVGKADLILCDDVTQCVDVVQRQGAISEPWTIFKIMRGHGAGQTIARWGVGENRQLVSAHPRGRTPPGWASTVKVSSTERLTVVDY